MILSADEVVPLEAALRGCGKDWAKTQTAMQAVIEACFPRSSWERLWRVHPVWRHVRKLPPPGQLKAVWDFIQLQVIALGIPMPSTPGVKAWLDAQEPKDGPRMVGS